MAKKVSRKILILDQAASGYAWIFSAYGECFYSCYHNKEEPFTDEELSDFLFIVFTGGSDITPSRYNETALSTTVSASYRDDFEFEIGERAIKLGIPMVGICRGAQFGCVLSGGKLDQHVKGHTGGQARRHVASLMGHSLSVEVSSDHHQIMRPSGVEHTTLMLGFDGKSEAVFFPKTKFLAVQYHPEWMGMGDYAVRLFDAYVRDYVLREGRSMVISTVGSIRASKATRKARHTPMREAEPVLSTVDAGPVSVSKEFL